MSLKSPAPAICLSLAISTAAHAQETFGNKFPLIDFLRAEVTQTGGMDLDGNPGDLSITSYQMRAVLSRPIGLFESLTMVPFFTYRTTQLDFDGTGAFPIHDEDLHSASLQAIFIQDFASSPWMGIGWTRAEMASDYQGIGEEDFTFDVAAGIGYRFNDCFMLGFGFAVINLNGDEEIFPGINFDWAPTENFRAGLYGPNLRVRYTFSDAWYVSLTGSPGGGVWNIRDDLGQSRSIEMDSYLIGLNTHHRISGEFWFNVGIGYTFNNEIEIRGNRGGGPSFSREMDGAPYAQVGVSLREW